MQGQCGLVAELVIGQLGQRVQTQANTANGFQNHAHRAAKVLVDAFEGLLDLGQAVFTGVLHQRQVFRLAAFCFIATQGGGGDVQPGNDIGITAGQVAAGFQLATHEEHGQVGKQAEAGGGPTQAAVNALGLGRHVGHFHGEETAGHTAHQAHHEAQQELDHPAGQVLAEGAHIIVFHRLHHVVGVGVAAGGALTEDHQGAGHDVGPFHGDAHRGGIVEAAHGVVGALHDAIAGGHVHGIGAGIAAHFGGVGLHDGGGHRRLDAFIHGGTAKHAGGIKGVGHARGLADFVLHPFHATHRDTELLAHHGIGAGDHGAVANAADTGGREGHHASASQGFHQHLPAHAGVLFAAQDIAGGNDHVAADDRAVGEMFADGLVMVADVQAVETFFQQYHSDAGIFTFTQQVFRVVQTYRQGDQIGDRRQGDVALAEVELEFDLAVAVLEHFAFRLDGGGVGTGGGFGQTKAGNELAVGQFR